MFTHKKYYDQDQVKLVLVLGSPGAHLEKMVFTKEFDPVAVDPKLEPKLNQIVNDVDYKITGNLLV